MFANGKLVDEVDESSRLPSDEIISRMPSRCNSASWIMATGGSRNGSYVYPHAPSPLHFTQLNSPKPTVFMPSPAPHFKPRRRRRNGFLSSCCCCSLFAALCSVLVTAALLLGLTALIAWLILRPIHAPRYSIENLEFTTLRVTDTLNANAAYTITANNPNRRLGFKYDVVDMETSYRGHVFARSAVGAFYQGHRNVTTLKLPFVVENYAFTPARLGSEFSADVKSGSVALHVRGSAKVRVKVGVITSFAVKVFVNCDFVVKPPAGSAPSSVTSKMCALTR